MKRSAPLFPLLKSLRRISLAAGKAILQIYESDNFETETKSDSSPVTKADLAADEVILAGLRQIAPRTRVVSEETVGKKGLPAAAERFFLVDPLDGTKEFIKRNGEFTVNIALIMRGTPVAGAVFAPAMGKLYLGAEGAGAWSETIEPKRVVAQGSAAPEGRLRTIHARGAPDEGLVAVASRSHRDPKTDEYLQQFKIASIASAGSSLKFCLVAEGEADIYPRHGTTMEWDTAAGHAVLLAAGGSVMDLEGRPLTYGKFNEELRNPYFVARGKV